MFTWVAYYIDNNKVHRKHPKSLKLPRVPIEELEKAFDHR
tara:strand:- start:3 stop:122 length:120 start_codon:yes stop_codon:yes gene_type:complete